MTTVVSALTLVFALMHSGQPPPGAELHGRVTDQETGRPIPRVTVRLQKVGTTEVVTAPTDDAGMYRFRDVAAGRYEGTVDPGLSATYPSQPLFRPSRIATIAEGDVREINVVLPRTRAIDVRVVDQWGDPLSNIVVSVTSASAGSGVPFARRIWATDDLGRLRVFGLAPGRYIVCAGADALGDFSEGTAAWRREGYLRTCYPTAASEAQAEPVRVDRSDVGELEIRMRRGPTFAISGQVIDAAGAPASTARVSLSVYWTNGSASRVMTVKPDGRFALANVPPGEYAIEASLGGPDRPEQRRPLEVAFLPLRIDVSDVEDLAVTLDRAVDVVGHVTRDDESAAMPRPGGSGLMVLARLAGERLPGSGSQRSTIVGTDNTFTLSGIFGRRTLAMVNVPPGWYVKSIRYRGKEIIDEAVQFGASTDPATLEIVLSNMGAVVSGRVADDDTAPVGGVVLLLRDRGAGSDVHVESRSFVTRAGTFHIGPVRGGDYVLVALPSDAAGVLPDERERLARLAAAGERITLTDLDQRTVDLRFVKAR